MTQAHARRGLRTRVRVELVQPGPLSAPRAARSLDTPSFRLIDFGRGRIAPERLLLDVTVYGQDDYARGRDNDAFWGDRIGEIG